MATESVSTDVPFEALIVAISRLSQDEKRGIQALLDDQLMEETGDPAEEAAVAEARAQAEAGEFVTLDDYVAGKRTP